MGEATHRLIAHRLKFLQNGKKGQLLAAGDLTKDEKNFLQRELLKDVRVRQIDFTGDMDEQIFDEVEMQVLSEWGVMCPHPPASRQRYNCSVCGCVVFPSGVERRLIAVDE